MSQEVNLVLAQCSHCGTNTTAPSKYSGLIFCSGPCKEAYTEAKRIEYLDAEAARFLQKCPDYYPCAHNQRSLSEFLERLELEPSAENLAGAFNHLAKAGKLLGKLTMRDVNAMDAPTYDARLRIDPEIGGTAEEIQTTGEAKFAAPTSYKTGGIGGWQRLAAANLADRQRQADERAINRRRS